MQTVPSEEKNLPLINLQSKNFIEKPISIFLFFKVDVLNCLNIAILGENLNSIFLFFPEIDDNLFPPRQTIVVDQFQLLHVILFSQRQFSNLLFYVYQGNLSFLQKFHQWLNIICQFVPQFHWNVFLVFVG